MKILIVVDMQNDFVYGPLGSPEAKAVVPRVEEKISEYAACDSRVVFTRDTHYMDYMKTQEGRFLPVEHCIKGSDGWNVVPELKGYALGDHGGTVDKLSFGYPEWKEELTSRNQIESIELVGVCTDICVVSNALILKALYPEIPIIVDASCCAGTTPENHMAALQVMKSCQIHVIGE